MKLKAIKPDKYALLSKPELQQQLVRRDSRENEEQFTSQLTEHRILRMGSAAGAALLTGILYQYKPSMESMMGTPVSLDHLLAFGGSVAAFYVEDENAAQAAEGVAMAGLVPLLRAAGRKVGGLSFG